MQQQNNNRVWLANYYHRQRALAIQQLKGLESMGVKPKYKDKKWEKSLLENDFFDNLDAVIVLTEWDIYSEINWGEASQKMKFPGWVFDTRLIVDEERVINSGLSFWRVGVGTVKRG